MSATTRIGLGLATAALVLLAASCTRRATQLVVVVETDLAERDYACIGIVVSRATGTTIEPGDRRMYAVPASVRVPFSLGVTPPDGDPGRRVQVTAEAWATCDEPGVGDVPIVSRSVRSGFLPEQTLRLSLFLADRCRTASVACPAEETCDPTTGTCVEIPDVPPEAITPGDELRDAAGSVDAGPRPDAGPPGACTPVAPIDYYTAPGTSFDVAGRPVALEWVLFVDTGTGVAVQTSALDGSGILAAAPLDTAIGANGITAVTVAGTDALLLAVWRSDLSRVDRHSLSAAGADMATPSLLLGSLRQRGVSAPFGSGALIAHDEQGVGDPLVLLRMTAGAAAAVYRSTVARDVGLGSRGVDGALAALTDGMTPAECSVLGISAAGVASPLTAVPVDTSCARTAIAELADGRVVMTFVDGDPGGAGRRAAYVVLDAALTTASAPIALGPAGTGRMSVSAGADGSFRVIWDGTTQVSTVHVDADGTVGTVEGLTAAGANHTAMRSARVGRTTAIVFPGGSGLVFAAVCD